MLQKETTEISGSKYATRRKELVDLVNQLRTIGAQGDLDLPRITVIGKQSAGKSSVVEGISGITVPRDAGTCTRCPMECRLSSSSAWCCRISIRREFDDGGKAMNEISEKKFGDTITDKSEVESALRRAQFAVLNPETPFAEILSISDPVLKELSSTRGKSLPFSRNIVCVDLEGPELTDLSFIDLPGLIQNAEPEDVQLVEDLVTSHIEGNSLILVALPVTDDIENQKALRLARRADPQGRRTIGVLTKPDMLSASSTNALSMWLDTIEGRDHHLKHGYYCTRQPDDAERERGISTKEARAAETSFFATTSPWATSVRKERLGTNNLIKTLSQLLIDIINESLPKIQSEAFKSMNVCKQELAALPPVIKTDPATYMQILLSCLYDDLQKYVQGTFDANVLIHNNRDAYAQLKCAIGRTAPNFIPCPLAACGNEAPVTSVDGDGEAEDLISEMKPFYLDDMRRHIERSITRELPGNVPYSAKATIIAASHSTWESSVIECFDQVRRHMVEILLECVDKIFKPHEHLRGLLTSFATEFAEKHYISCLEFLDATLEAELAPYTQNYHYLEACSAKWLSKYKDARAQMTRQTNPAAPEWQETSVEPPDDEKLNSILASLSAIGYTGLQKDDLGKLNPPDEYETELKVMAEVRGYFQVSYKRIIDTVPLLIDLKFVKAVGGEILQFLITKFKLGTVDGNSRCAAYLVEDPITVASRTELLNRKAMLEEVQQKLYNFGL